MKNDLTAEQVLQRFLDKKPFSLIRYGDGEAIILNGFRDVISLKAIFKRQFGFTPSIEEAEQIRANLIKAYQECDILGTPLNKKIGDKESYWAKSVELMRTEAGIDLHATTREQVSIDVHSHFLDKGYYDKILSSVDTLNYISCRDLDEEFKQRFPNLKTVNKFLIAPEVKFSTNTTGEKHYPDQFNKVVKWMDKAINCQDSICLVGAGYVGKIYCNWFRDRGGMAMDIGSVFDAWAGKDTRGPSRGLDVIDNTYKL